MNIKIILLLFALLTPVNALIIPYSLISIENGFIIAGSTSWDYSRENESKVQALIVKISPNGDIIWNKTYGYATAAYVIVKLEEGYGVGGVMNGDAWIMKIDEEGNILWQKTYGCRDVQDSAVSVVADGKDIVALITVTSCDVSNRDVWVLRFDREGNEIWRKVFDFGRYDSIKMAKKTRDGGLIAVGAVSEDLVKLNYDIWVLKLDAQGNEEWSKFFDFGFQEVAWDVAELENGYAVVGGSWIMVSIISCKQCNQYSTGDNFTSLARGFVLKLDLDGNLNESKFLEFGLISSAWSVETINGKIVIAGLGVNSTSAYLWISTPTEVIAIHGGDFNIIPVIYGVARLIGTEDGYLMTASGCNGSCLWTGKFDFDGKLMWKIEYRFDDNRTENNIISPVQSETEQKWQTSEINMNLSSDGEKNVINRNIDPFLLYATILLILALILVYVISRF
ncbi:MAG: hypothetical protein QXP46_01420 [Archaeoglobaceae archaeon]